MNPSRIVFFIDYQNFHGSALRAFWPRDTHPANGHINPLGLGHLIAERRTASGYPSRLVQARIYRGYPDRLRQPGSAAANDRQTAQWTRSPLVEVKRRPLRYPRGWPAQPAVEKGIDVSLAVDVVRLAIVDQAYDVGVVASADSDLLPAIETVMDLRCAHIEVAAWRGTARLQVPGSKRPWCHWLKETDYRNVEDTNDYSRPRARTMAITP